MIAVRTDAWSVSTSLKPETSLRLLIGAGSAGCQLPPSRSINSGKPEREYLRPQLLYPVSFFLDLSFGAVCGRWPL